jgi:hypothetical protein
MRKLQRARFWCIEMGAPRGGRAPDHQFLSKSGFNLTILMGQHNIAAPRLGGHSLRRNLFAKNRNVAGRLDANANLIAIDLHYRDPNIVADHDLLTQLPAQNQHGHLPVDESISETLIPNQHPHTRS